MRTSIFLITLGIALTSAGQSWCPPGATWVFEPTNPIQVGGKYVWYAGDTLVDGMAAQRLASYSYYYTLFDQELITSNVPEYLITASADDVIWKWSPWEQAWDTLFWFGAQVGDHWLPPHTDVLDQSEKIVLIGVDTITIEGVELRRLQIEQVCEGMWIDWAGPIIERIGYTTPFYFPPTCGTETTFWTFTCYSDDEIQYGTTPCMITLAIDLSTSDALIRPFPNPGTDAFTLQLPPGPHQLTLFDAQGRQVLSQQLSEELPVISTASLPSGIYHIHITDRSGRISGQRWVKE